MCKKQVKSKYKISSVIWIERIMLHINIIILHINNNLRCYFLIVFLYYWLIHQLSLSKKLKLQISKKQLI